MERSAIVGWNLPNFVSFVLMLGLIWAGVGIISHLLVRSGGKSGSVFAANANVRAGPVGANVNIAA